MSELVVGGLVAFALLVLAPPGRAVGRDLAVHSLRPPRAWSRAVTPWTRRRIAETDAAAVLETCEVLAAELQAGRPPGEALSTAAGQWPPWRPVVEAFQLGGDVPTALRELAHDRRGAADLRLVAAAWQVAHRSGNGLARALDRTARGIRARRRTHRLIQSELASSRATARLVACLPVLVLMGGSGAGASPWAFLLTTPVGLACLAAGAGLTCLGLWWIEMIAHRAASP